MRNKEDEYLDEILNATSLYKKKLEKLFEVVNFISDQDRVKRALLHFLLTGLIGFPHK